MNAHLHRWVSGGLSVLWVLAVVGCSSPGGGHGLPSAPLAEGMTSAEVLRVWGVPSRRFTYAGEEGDELRWEYWRTWIHPRLNWDIEYHGSQASPRLDSRASTRATRYLSAWVTFRNERVIRWQHRLRAPLPAEGTTGFEYPLVWR